MAEDEASAADTAATAALTLLPAGTDRVRLAPAAVTGVATTLAAKNAADRLVATGPPTAVAELIAAAAAEALLEVGERTVMPTVTEAEGAVFTTNPLAPTLAKIAGEVVSAGPAIAAEMDVALLPCGRITLSFVTHPASVAEQGLSDTAAALTFRAAATAEIRAADAEAVRLRPVTPLSCMFSLRVTLPTEVVAPANDAPAEARPAATVAATGAAEKLDVTGRLSTTTVPCAAKTVGITAAGPTACTVRFRDASAAEMTPEGAMDDANAAMVAD